MDARTSVTRPSTFSSCVSRPRTQSMGVVRPPTDAVIVPVAAAKRCRDVIDVGKRIGVDDRCAEHAVIAGRRHRRS